MKIKCMNPNRNECAATNGIFEWDEKTEGNVVLAKKGEKWAWCVTVPCTSCGFCHDIWLKYPVPRKPPGGHSDDHVAHVVVVRRVVFARANRNLRRLPSRRISKQEL